MVSRCRGSNHRPPELKVGRDEHHGLPHNSLISRRRRQCRVTPRRLRRGGTSRLLYGSATIRGNENEDDACVLVSEMEKVVRVLAATAVYVCRRRPAGLALS